MNIRNAQYKNKESTIIDVEIEHEVHGWLPYTFISNETDESFDDVIRVWLESNTPSEYVETPKTVEELEVEAKQAKSLALSTLTVTTSNGNTFDGNETARNNMMSAILSADLVGSTEDEWKLADNTTKVITLDELKEALALAIQKVGEIVRA